MTRGSVPSPSMRTTFRILFVLYLIVAAAALVVVYQDPFWRHGGYNGFIGFMATLIAAVPWSLLLFVVDDRVLSPYISETGLGFVLWGFVALNLTVLYWALFGGRRTASERT
jgi:F0F1-type ATP synthase assembly protein I